MIRDTGESLKDKADRRLCASILPSRHLQGWGSLSATLLPHRCSSQ